MRCSRSRYSICAHSGGVGKAVHGRRSATAPSAPWTAALAPEAIGAELPRSGCYQSFPVVTSHALPVTDEILPRIGHVPATCPSPTCRGSTSINRKNRSYQYILPTKMTSRSSLTTLTLQKVSPTTLNP
eukprot:2702010-Prymnesium_polylepis.1